MGLTAAVEEGLTKAVTEATSYLATSEVWLSLHSANPGTSGANEVTTGTGPQGRQQVTFTGSDGTDTNVSEVTIQLVDETVTYVGYWSAQTGGTWLGGFPLVGTGTILAAATSQSILTAPSHGRSIGDVVKLYDLPGPAASAIPAGFATDTRYWVVAVPDISHLSLSASEDGLAITTTGAGACGMYLDQGEYGSSGLLTFPASSGITYVTTS